MAIRRTQGTLAAPRPNTDLRVAVRAVIPLFDTEVRGVEMLRRMAESLFIG